MNEVIKSRNEELPSAELFECESIIHCIVDKSKIFTIRWTFKNTGDSVWPKGIQLVRTAGDFIIITDHGTTKYSVQTNEIVNIHTTF